MAGSEFKLIFALLLVATTFASAKVVRHWFHVQNLRVERLCGSQVITAVNGSLPGPTLEVQEGDTLIVHVFNKSPYNLSIHWHGVFQSFSGWADGADFITQWPIFPGNKYTYKFNITRQEGTLWWHAHDSWLRATVYGALIIRPSTGRSFPFPKPRQEFPVILGEWWNANVFDVQKQGLASGAQPNISDAFTINGLPGPLYPCSANNPFTITVMQGETYLLRIINAALNNHLFFKIANHKVTVVAIDASYTTPYVTDVIVLGPGQTTDLLLTADQPQALYYMAAHPYSTALRFDNTTTTGIIAYSRANASTPVMPDLPAFNDTRTAHKFSSNLTGLVSGPFWKPVPLDVDEHMFVTVGLGMASCGLSGKGSCKGPHGKRLAASMNNASFQLPTKLPILQAFSENVSGVFTVDFPTHPKVIFDYTDSGNSYNLSLVMTEKSTKVKKIKYNSVVEIVIQNTDFLIFQDHPIHLHGSNFHVLAEGFGNYDPINDGQKFNLINPQERNTIAVPVGGWVVIRFRANNPGAWIIHCHTDVHFSWGLATVFIVENGPAPSTTLIQPSQILKNLCSWPIISSLSFFLLLLFILLHKLLLERIIEKRVINRRSAVIKRLYL